MQSWEKHLQGYKFIEWNEENFDLNQNLYVKQAYEAGKYAFVSDYARLHALYTHGGIYLDTDVEVLRSLDRFLVHDAFSGFEDDRFLQSGTMGAVKGHPWIKELMDYYEGRSFLRDDGTPDQTTNTAVMTEICSRKGLVLNGQYQVLSNGVVFYPRTYFSPYDYVNGGNYITEESYTIHHFAKSWLPARVRFAGGIKRMAGRYLGPRFVAAMRKMIK
jgi:hypothetical protein